MGLPLVRRLALPFPVLVDAGRDTYRRYGLGKAAFVIQKSATFVIDRDGVVRHATAGFDPTTAMDLGAVLETLASLATPTPPGGGTPA